MLEQSPEDYFRKSIIVPFLYCTLNEMKTRFTDLHARREPLCLFGTTVGSFNY
jgi:hypothetical protein